MIQTACPTCGRSVESSDLVGAMCPVCGPEYDLQDAVDTVLPRPRWMKGLGLTWADQDRGGTVPPTYRPAQPATPYEATVRNFLGQDHPHVIEYGERARRIGKEQAKEEE